MRRPVSINHEPCNLHTDEADPLFPMVFGCDLADRRVIDPSRFSTSCANAFASNRGSKTSKAQVN
jgi:hypothetical protein